MTLRFVEPGTREWVAMWDALAKDPLNRGLPDPRAARNREFGESWQYMGTEARGHCFRHRAHPKTGNREYVYIRIGGYDAPGHRETISEWETGL